MSLSEPHIDHDKRPRTGSNCTRESVSFTPRLSHMFQSSVYTLTWTMHSSILTCSCVWLSTQQGLELLIVCRAMETGMRTCRHMVWTDWAYWDSGAVVAKQLATVPVWNNCTAVLWNTYWNTIRHDTTSAGVLVVGCWAIQCRDITGTAGSYCRSVQ